jgi:hypothetical protein
MALKPNTAPPKGSKKPTKITPGSWKLTMPGRITAEDAEAEPRSSRLFPDA